MSSARTWSCLAAFALVALSGCRDNAEGNAAQSPSVPAGGGATPAVVVSPPPPGKASALGSEAPKAPAVVPLGPPPTACGAETLLNYLNLLPTQTAKEEIVKTLGHSRVRYVGLAEAKASASPTSNRVTAGLGADGRIKQFTCG